jgi:hypothetical protein
MQRKQSRLGVFILLIVFVFFGWWIKTSCYAKAIQFDLRQEDVAKQFEVSNAQWTRFNDRGLQLECPESCYILTPLTGSAWEDFSYIKIRVVEPRVPSGEMLLFWSGKDGAGGKRRIKLAGSEENYIVSAKSFRPWEQELPWRGQIGKIGVGAVSGTFAISEIHITDTLTPWEWIQFSAYELGSIEPLLAYSINIIWGASIGGWSLTAIGGSLAVLFLLTAIYRRGFHTGKAMLCLVFVLILMVDAPFLASLIHTLKSAARQTAWRSGREEEDRSRFGPEYAELASTLRRVAPVGSTIFIPHRRPDQIQGESEWIAFQLWPQYRQVLQAENADYVLLLHPLEAKYDSASGALILSNKNPIRVIPLATSQADVMLLKRQRD